MYLAYRWSSKDLGRAELVIAVIIISVILGAFINKTLQLFALTERHLIEASVTNMRVALRLQAAIQALGNGSGAIELAEGMNPALLTQYVPDDYEQYINGPQLLLRAKQFSVKPLTNYLGELYDPDIELLERGNWYFDYNGNYLVYLTEYAQYSGGKADGQSELKYSVNLDYTDSNNNQRYDPGKDILKTISLDAADIHK